MNDNWSRGRDVQKKGGTMSGGGSENNNSSDNNPERCFAAAMDIWNALENGRTGGGSLAERRKLHDEEKLAFGKCVQLLVRAAEEGQHAPAMQKLAYLCSEGIGMAEPNLEEAELWGRAAVDRLHQAFLLPNNSADPDSDSAAAVASGSLAPLVDKDLLVAVGFHAVLLCDLGRHAEAVPLFREALCGLRLAMPAGHSLLLGTMDSLATALYALNGGTLDEEGEALRREHLAGLRATLGGAHSATLLAAHQLACGLAQGGRFADAEPLLREAAAGFFRLEDSPLGGGGDGGGECTQHYRLHRRQRQQQALAAARDLAGCLSCRANLAFLSSRGGRRIGSNRSAGTSGSGGSGCSDGGEVGSAAAGGSGGSGSRCGGGGASFRTAAAFWAEAADLLVSRTGSPEAHPSVQMLRTKVAEATALAALLDAMQLPLRENLLALEAAIAAVQGFTQHRTQKMRLFSPEDETADLVLAEDGSVVVRISSPDREWRGDGRGGGLALPRAGGGASPALGVSSIESEDREMAVFVDVIVEALAAVEEIHEERAAAAVKAAEEARVASKARALCLRIFNRLVNRVIAISIEHWLGFVDGQKAAEVELQRLERIIATFARRFSEKLAHKAMNTWIGMVDEVKRQRALCTQAFLKLLGIKTVCAFGYWAAATAQQRRHEEERNERRRAKKAEAAARKVAESARRRADEGALARERSGLVCANCGVASANGAELAPCGRCGNAFYCSRACRIAHWRQSHEKRCRAPWDVRRTPPTVKAPPSPAAATVKVNVATAVAIRRAQSPRASRGATVTTNTVAGATLGSSSGGGGGGTGPPSHTRTSTPPPPPSPPPSPSPSLSPSSPLHWLRRSWPSISSLPHAEKDKARRQNAGRWADAKRDTLISGPAPGVPP